MKIFIVITTVLLGGCVPMIPQTNGGYGYSGYGGYGGYRGGYGPTYSSQRAYDLNQPDGYPRFVSPYNRAYR